MKAIEIIQDKIINSIKKVEDGDLNPLLVITELEDMRTMLNDTIKIIEEFKEANIDELAMLATDYPEGYGGYRFEYRNGAKRFNFKGCPTWVDLETRKKHEEQKLKLMWESATKGMTTVDENGEVMPLPEVSYSKSSLIMKKIYN